MSGNEWSWLLTAIGVTGLYLAGDRRASGWLVCLCGQSLWASYAVATRQWGFLAAACVYGALYGRNLHRARTMAAADAHRAEHKALLDAATAKANILVCGAFQPPQPDGLASYRCTAHADHVGEHRAWVDGRYVATWPRSPR